MSDAESENEDDKNLSWEENLKRLVKRHSNDYTNELELWIGGLENNVQELKDEIKKLKKKLSSKKIEGEGEKQKRKIEELQNENEEQKKRIEELHSENSALLAYKKFFEDVKLRMSEFP